MNRSELKELEDGETIIFTRHREKLTEGKEYVVRKTGVGRMVVDDNGIGQFLHPDLHQLFDKKNKPLS